MKRTPRKALPKSSEAGVGKALLERLALCAWKETLADLTPGLAHDFNNTLTGILGLSEAFLAQIDSEHPFHEGLSLIKQMAQQAGQIVHCLSRLHQEKTGSRGYHDLNAVTAEVVEILSKILPHRIEVRARFDPAPLPVWVDVVELRHVLLTLAFGAFKATAGRGRLHFQTSRHRTLPTLRRVQGKLPLPPLACLSVAQSGSGFDVRQFDSMADPSSLPGQGIEGAVLGLLLARLFAEKNRGAISAKSNRGAGATLSLWLPEADFTEG